MPHKSYNSISSYSIPINFIIDFFNNEHHCNKNETKPNPEKIAN